MARVKFETTTLQEVTKNRQIKKCNDIEYKKVKCFTRALAAHFDQFLTTWSKYGLAEQILVMILTIKFFFMFDRLLENRFDAL